MRAEKADGAGACPCSGLWNLKGRMLPGVYSLPPLLTLTREALGGCFRALPLRRKVLPLITLNKP